MARRHHLPILSRWRRRLHAPGAPLAAGLLALLLLLAQGLGLLHRQLHATPLPLGTAVAVNDPASNTARNTATKAAPQSGAASLFAQHDRGSIECRLYDQVAHGDLMPLPVVALPTIEPVWAPPPAVARAAPRPAGCPFQARAPPPLA